MRHLHPPAKPPRLRPLPFDQAAWESVVADLKLSPRLAGTAELLLRGMEGKEIAARMGIGLPTVRTYLDRVYRRAGEHDRVGFILHVFALVVRRGKT